MTAHKIITIGDIVLYRLASTDTYQINKRRQDWQIYATDPMPEIGYQAHVGNDVDAGELAPMIVTMISQYDGSLNGQVMLDGNDSLWVETVERDPDDGSDIDGRWAPKP